MVEDVLLLDSGDRVPADARLVRGNRLLMDTSMLTGEIVSTLTDDGLPPRDRFETVPAVEITVPRFVCSTKWIASW